MPDTKKKPHISIGNLGTFPDYRKRSFWELLNDEISQNKPEKSTENSNSLAVLLNNFRQNILKKPNDYKSTKQKEEKTQPQVQTNSPTPPSQSSFLDFPTKYGDFVGLSTTDVSNAFRSGMSAAQLEIASRKDKAKRQALLDGGEEGNKMPFDVYGEKMDMEVWKTLTEDGKNRVLYNRYCLSTEKPMSFSEWKKGKPTSSIEEKYKFFRDNPWAGKIEKEFRTSGAPKTDISFGEKLKNKVKTIKTVDDIKDYRESIKRITGGELTNVINNSISSEENRRYLNDKAFEIQNREEFTERDLIKLKLDNYNANFLDALNKFSYTIAGGIEFDYETKTFTIPIYANPEDKKNGKTTKFTYSVKGVF